MASVRGAPSSHFAYTTGLPGEPHSVMPTSYTRDSWQPSCSKKPFTISADSGMPSPLFEMLGWRIHFCRFSTWSSM